MAAATDELILLERVFLRLGSAETDEQLQAAVCKFLPPVLLKLSSSQEGVRKKVLELLVHINKRIKSRPQVQLPVEALLLQYQDPSASSFVINFTIIYIKLGYPRMEMRKQAELVPSILNAIEGKPLSHQDSLLLIIMPALGHINIPTDPERRASLLGLHDKLCVGKQLLNFMLDMLLLPYGSVGQTRNQQSGQSIDGNQFTVPPGLSEYAFKRVIGENPLKADQLEKIKLGIVKFLSGGFFPDADILVHLIVAVSDTRFTVTTLADVELRRIASTLDWSSMQLAAPLYTLFLGTDAPGMQKEEKPEMKRLPASTRIRLKVLQYLCHVTKAGFIITPCIQVVFNSLYGKNTNPKLKSLALQFTSNIVQQSNLVSLSRVAAIILDGMVKLISEGENALKPMAYTIIGQLGQRIPSLINKDLSLLHNLFDTLVFTDGELQRTVRDALICITSAFVLNKKDESNIALMNALLSVHIESSESSARFVAMHYAATVFPPDDAASRYLLLLACGDNKHEISTEATKALYGVVHKSEDSQQINKKILLPEFTKLVSYVYSKMQPRIPTATNSRNTDKHVLPYNVTTFSEIITYFRVCLAKSANIPTQNEPLQHPSEFTPLIGRYLENLYKNQPEILNNYLKMILLLCHSSADQISLNALLEVLGSVPHYITKEYEKELPWLRTLLTSAKQDIRQLAAKVYAAVTGYLPRNEFEKYISSIMDIMNKKNLEAQHGALMTLTYMMERNLMQQRNGYKEELYNWKTYHDIVKTICTHLHDNTTLLMDAAIQTIGLLGKTYSLPVPAEGDNKFNKKAIVDMLFSVLSNVKLNTKMKEKAAISLGYLCVGEPFPYTADIANKILTMVKETKDIEIHLILGETLVCCVQGQASPEARNAWTTLPTEHVVSCSKENDELLVHVLDELFKIYQVPHPNLRQAVCVWLFALLKHNVQRECIKERLSTIHHAFIDFLSDDSDIVQDVAAKGLSLVHINSKQEERDALVSNILDQFTSGRKTVQQVTADTKLFEEGQLGKSPSGGNLSTYREICSLATELQKPELVYYFMHLANHNAIWTSKKGAAFGFAAIASIAQNELNKYLPNIIPRLYRYQYDPTPKIQQSMTSIWRAVVPSTTKAIEQYHKEILADVTENLTNNEWRVRISCCNALADLLRTNVQFNFSECGPELWTKLFRVMDDIHEGTRIAATNTTKILSKVCIRHCDSSHGNAGKEVIHAILPVLLDIGITNSIHTVRVISLQTVSQLVSTAGVLLKPSLVNLIPSLLETIGESENPKLSYLSNMCGATTETQEAIDNIRANVAKGHYASDTITKCIQYIDTDVLKNLMPKVIDLIKCSVGFGTKIACSHFIILLSTHLKENLQPYSAKILSALLNGLLDRNAAVRKNNAVSIGHIVYSAKDSSLEKLFNTLNTWYLEREDDAIRLAIGQALQSINNYNQEKWKNYKKVVIPLVFFAMHAEKVPGNESTVELWTDLWNDITPGTEAGIVQNLEAITNILHTALESSSWTTKMQAANAIHTIALKSGHNIDEEARNSLLKILTDGLNGRTWNGKERLLNALAVLACSSKEVLNTNTELCDAIVKTLYRESKKENVEYRRDALQAFAMVLHELDIDKFTEIYEIVQETLIKISKNNDDEENTAEENRKKKENNIKLQETIYEVLGKAWPSTKETQDIYCIEFVTHCQKVLANSTRSVQVAILTALNLFVDKLVLLKMKKAETSPKDKKLLDEICDSFNKILSYCMNISKFTRIRKEALNIVLSLTRKMRETNNDEQLEKITRLVKELLPDLTKDNQPEIRTRVVDIKEILKI